MAVPPIRDDVTIQDLTADPYAFYKTARSESPVVTLPNINRTLLTKAVDCRMVKDNPGLFSSNDPTTPMEKAFEAHTLMRKDGDAHLVERNAMMPTFSPRNLKTIWGPMYEKLVDTYLDRLPKDEVVDLFPTLAGPLAARILAETMGMSDASDEDMQFWSQALIDGAGNFGWFDEPFERAARANAGINANLDANLIRLRAAPDQSALSVMIHADDPIPFSQIRANIKIAIGGGINEPRDATLTILYGLLTNPDQLDHIKQTGDWPLAFEEGVRWVAPIQASSRLVMQDTQIGGHDIAKGTVVMTCQASANHDEDLFEDGHLYNVFRKSAPHQSFGSGPHHCMGTHMARMMVGRILLPKMFERFPNMHLPDPKVVKWKGFGFRGPLNLPVRLT